MKTLTLITALALALVVAAPAGAARGSTAKGPTLRSLQTQITTLKKQVKALQKRVKDAENLSLGALAFSGCSVAVDADALQGTWTTLDSHFGTAMFGAQTPLNDSGLCTAFSVTRAPNQATTSVFGALLSLFRGQAASIEQRVESFARAAGTLLRPLLSPAD